MNQGHRKKGMGNRYRERGCGYVANCGLVELTGSYTPCLGAGPDSVSRPSKRDPLNYCTTTLYDQLTLQLNTQSSLDTFSLFYLLTIPWNPLRPLIHGLKPMGWQQIKPSKPHSLVNYSNITLHLMLTKSNIYTYRRRHLLSY